MIREITLKEYVYSDHEEAYLILNFKEDGKLHHREFHQVHQVHLWGDDMADTWYGKDGFTMLPANDVTVIVFGEEE